MKKLGQFGKQAGFTLVGFLLFAGLASVIAVEAARTYPVLAEFYEIRKLVRKLSTTSTDPAEIRHAFDKATAINGITSITSQDLKIRKTPESGVVISVAYDGWVHLFKNVNIVIQFKASSNPAADVDND